MEFLENLYKKVKLNAIKRVVLPESEDKRILSAANTVLKESYADIILLGNKDEIYRNSKEFKSIVERLDEVVIDPDKFSDKDKYIDALYELRKHKGLTKEQANTLLKDYTYFATMLVHLADADACVSGATHTTADTIRPAFQIIKTKENISIVSSIFFMVFEHKTFVFGDCAVNPNPNAKQLADIALASSVTAKIALSDIRLAFLSYSTGKSGFGVDVDLVNNAISEFKNICPPDVKFDGPIQYDAAVDKRVAKAKMPNSEVAGSANVFIFPNLTAGNICYKAVQNTGNLLAVGPILQGLNKPINDLSRGATTDDIVNTILVTALQSSL